MKSTFNAVVFACAIFVCGFGRASAQGCIASFEALSALQVARGNNVSTPVTYIMCPNTVYIPNFDDAEFGYFELNGNATYLCGANGSSSNNCTVRGGFFQLTISLYAFDFAVKDNILISGFTFEAADISSGTIASPGRFTIRDCIFQVTEFHCLSKLLIDMKLTAFFLYLIISMSFRTTTIMVFSITFFTFLPPYVVRCPSKRNETSCARILFDT
jgi:hypothetical protein